MLRPPSSVQDEELALVPLTAKLSAVLMAISDAAEPEGTLTAPGSRVCSWSDCRPFNGSSRTRPESTTSFNVELKGSTVVTLTRTATTSRTSPTCMATSTRPRWLTSTNTLPTSALRNPGASQETL